MEPWRRWRGWWRRTAHVLLHCEGLLTSGVAAGALDYVALNDTVAPDVHVTDADIEELAVVGVPFFCFSFFFFLTYTLPSN